MTATMRADSRNTYSWWWDSHICPKNSKWLHQNLTDMDAKVKQMIKLIEEDADSFAMRAEMYYKKRPELMKLVEDFYRAYRALAERYDHATIVIRQAHRTIEEAYPNQVPILLSDVSSETDAHLLQTTPPASMIFGLDDSVTIRKGMNELDESFLYEETRNQVNDLVSSEAEQVEKAEIEISSSKQVLSKLEDENDVINVERLSNLESEVFQAQENFRLLNEQAINAQSEVQALKESITKLKTEREIILLHYHKCLENISTLEKNISCVQKEYGELMDQACRTEIEVESFKEDIARVEAEKEAALVLSSTVISNLEKKLRHETENAELYKEQADRAGIEVLTLKESLTKYQECLEKITSLEHQIAVTRDEAKSKHNEIVEGVAKLKGAEEKCQLLERSNQSLQSELGLTLQKMRLEGEELKEKQKEMTKLWTCIEEERLRHSETQSSFRTLRNIHSQAQGDIIAMASEIQSKTQNLQEMETQTKALENAVEKVEEEKKSLKELYLSSVISTNNLDVEISSLKEKTNKLEAEVELHLDQSHALQEEVYFLKKDLAGLNKKNRALLVQVESVGFNPECFGSSVKVLQKENSKLREISEIDKNERAALLDKMKIMGELLDKNEILEVSVSSLHAELEGVREKVEMLEDSCQSLLREKRNLVAERTGLTSQLQSVSENYINLSEKSISLENSLSDAIKELKEMTVKSNCLEESCFFLNRDNSRMISEREKLESQLEISMKTVEDQQNRYVELEENHFGLIREREYALCEVEELQNLLEAAKREHASLNQLAQTKSSQVCQLQEEGDIRKKELEDKFEKAITANIKIFILQSFLRDAAKYNFSCQLTSERLLDGSKDSTMFSSDLRQENIKRQVEVQALFDQMKTLRMGMDHMLETLQINEDHGHEDKRDLKQSNVHDIVIELENMQQSLSKCRCENQQLVIEKMVIIELLRQLQSEAALVVKRDTIDELWNKNQKVLQLNENFIFKFLESRQKEKDLRAEIESVSRKLLETQQMMRLMLSERTELSKMMEKLANQQDQVKASQENQGKLTVNLSGVSDNQVKETGYLSEWKNNFEIILKILVDEVEQYKSRVEMLSYRLQKKRNEVDMLETQAAVSFEELQITAVREGLFEGKFFELIEAYEKLQNSKEKENVMLKEENGKLVFENYRLQSQLASCIPPLICLKDSLTSMEGHVALTKKVDKDDEQKTKCVILASHLCAEKFPQSNDSKRDIMVDVSAELWDVQKRIHLVDLAVMQKMNANASLEMVDMKEIEEIKSRSSSRRENRQTIKHPSSQLEESKRERLRRPKFEISEEGSDILMKDITLDHITKSPSGRISRRQIIEADRHVFELWESTNKDSSIDLTVGNSKRLPTLSTNRYQNEAVMELKGSHASINALIEMELDVNKLESSKRVSEPRHERNRKKIVERLESDVQRLTNLQISLQDLKKMVEMNEKTKTICVENEDAKRQLEEADAAILKLFDLNCKLKKSAEGRSIAMDGFSVQGADGSASVRNRIVSAQARRGSEKIGQLQSEVQKLQFLLLKMEDEKVNMSRIRVTEMTQRVLLKDYLYGGKRTHAPHKQKKPPFCGCVQTPSRGEWSN